MNIILNNRVPRLEIKTMCTCLNIPSSKPKKPTSSNHRHLSHLLENRIPPQYC
ncbi:hypothetical protein HanRHA438_Chr01g0033101 [Helianthus annuus]|nr:hypothetical protein HanRHA438_Chr01g0033101 [Helianthus annuus]